MFALGWELFAVLYFIGFASFLVADIASYSGGLIPWRWRWALLGWPWLLLSDAWDRRQAAWNAFRRRAP